MQLPQRNLFAVPFFLLICASFVFATLSAGQSQPLNRTGSTNCTASDFDTDAQFVNEPGDYYSVIINMHNISGRMCVFDGQTYGPTFFTVPASGSQQIAFDPSIAYDFATPDPRDTAPVAKPGQTARITLRWRTTQPEVFGPCPQVKWIDAQVSLLTPSLFKKVCSAIRVSLISVVSSPAPQPGSPDVVPLPHLRLSSDKSAYFGNENFSLNVSLANAAPDITPRDQGCPTLYLRVRAPDGFTIIQETRPLAFQGCPANVGGLPVGDWKSGFQISGAQVPSALNGWAVLGERTVQVFQLVNSPNDSQLHFASSNLLRIQMLDPNSIVRKWGPQVKGIAADITLDKDTYRLGEDIPLHLAIENFDAEVPVYWPDPRWDPCGIIAIEVQDALGHPLPFDQRFPSYTVCVGDHGFGPKPYAKGMMIPLERKLGAEGWLPNQPGTYTIVVSWSPILAPDKDTPTVAGWPTSVLHYATTQARATIHIVAENAQPPR